MGEEDSTHILVTDLSGVKHPLFLWRDIDTVTVKYKLATYSVQVDNKDQALILTSQKEGQLVEANTGKIEMVESLEKWLDTRGKYFSIAYFTQPG